MLIAREQRLDHVVVAPEGKRRRNNVWIPRAAAAIDQLLRLTGTRAIRLPDLRSPARPGAWASESIAVTPKKTRASRHWAGPCSDGAATPDHEASNRKLGHEAKGQALALRSYPSPDRDRTGKDTKRIHSEQIASSLCSEPQNEPNVAGDRQGVGGESPSQ